jgi:hypothetical protein
MVGGVPAPGAPRRGGAWLRKALNHGTARSGKAKLRVGLRGVFLALGMGGAPAVWQQAGADRGSFSFMRLGR